MASISHGEARLRLLLVPRPLAVSWSPPAKKLPGLLSGRHGYEVSADRRKARLGFQCAGELQKAISILGVVPPSIEIGQEPTRPLHAVDLRRREAGLGDLGPQLVRVMEEGVHEVFRPARRIPVLSVDQIPSDNLGELRVLQESPAQTIEGRGKTGDGRRKADTTRPDYWVRFT